MSKLIIPIAPLVCEHLGKEGWAKLVDEIASVVVNSEDRCRVWDFGKEIQQFRDQIMGDDGVPGRCRLMNDKRSAEKSTENNPALCGSKIEHWIV